MPGRGILSDMLGPRLAATILACVAILVCWPTTIAAKGAQPDRASAAERERAQTEYRAGTLAFKEGRYRDAADSFHKSYDIVASPNSHMMWARALREAGEYDRAYEEMALAQREAAKLAINLPKYAATAESTEAELAELLPRVAALNIQLKNGDAMEVWVNRRRVRRSLWPAIAVREGEAHVAVRLHGGRRAWAAVNAKRGQVQRVELDLAGQLEAGDDALIPWLSKDTAKPDPPAKLIEGASDPATQPDTADPGADSSSASGPGLRMWSYVAGGVGALGLVTFAVAGSMSNATHADLEAECPNGACPASQSDKIDQGKRQQTVANIGLVVGVIGVAAGATLFILDLDQDKKTGQRTQLVAGPGSLRLRGRF